MNHTYIPNNLKALRRNTNLRQQDLAVKLGFEAFDRISRWEMGLAYPSLEMLAKLMRLFKVQPIEIYPELFAVDEPTSNPAHPSMPASPATSQSDEPESHQTLP